MFQHIFKITAIYISSNSSSFSMNKVDSSVLITDGLQIHSQLMVCFYFCFGFFLFFLVVGK